MSKLLEYVGFFHVLKEHVRETWTQCLSKVKNSDSSVNDDVVRGEVNINFRTRVSEKLERLKRVTIQKIDHSILPSSTTQPDFSHVYRTKTRGELYKISAAVMGIEFAYAAETAFVSPLLLNIGLHHRNLTLMWFLSPLLGFFITPLLGSMSDGCRLQMGRRRPFIILLSIGIILGLILVPNGKTIGIWFGDTYKQDENLETTTTTTNLLLLPSSGFSIYKNSTSITFQSTTSLVNFTDKEFINKTFGGFKSNVHGTKRIEEEKKKWNDLVRKKRSSKIFNEDDDWKLNQKQKQKQKNQKRLEIHFQQEDIFHKKIVQEVEVEEQIGQGQIEPFVSINSTTGNSIDKLIQFQNTSSEDQTSTTTTTTTTTTTFQHSWGLIITVLGTILLDFDADACQSPARAFMLDITLPKDHAQGLSAFTVMAGLGGSIGYFLGALNWENTFIGDLFGGHVRAVFTLVLFIFIGCVVTTLRSFEEIPIDRLWTSSHNVNKVTGCYVRFNDDNNKNFERGDSSGTTEDDENSFSETDNNPIKITKGNYITERSTEINIEDDEMNLSTPHIPTFHEYVKTIICLPKSLQWLCLTNFFSWISLVCYSLYFTDFVGEAVFEGDPTAPNGSKQRINYEYGVRFGCIGMSFYSLSCAIYSLQIQNLVQRFGSKRVYICGQLIYGIGMMCMGITRHPVGVLIFSWTAGIMYATLFTMPYLLVARYHAADTFDFHPENSQDDGKPTQRRGLGTDVAIVSSMVFLAQMTQALTLGSIVAVAGTTTAIVYSASILAFCGALSATKVLYLDL